MPRGNSQVRSSLKCDPLMVIALHEAGHAVAGIRLGLPLREVVIESDDLSGKARFGVICLLDRKVIQRAIVAAYAGPAASLEFCDSHEGLEEDFEDAESLVQHLPGRGEKILRRLRIRTWCFVRFHRKEIERVAAKLLAKRRLSGEEVRELLRSGNDEGHGDDHRRSASGRGDGAEGVGGGGTEERAKDVA